MNAAQRMVKPLVGIGLALMIGGCGSASNNDQGVSFTNLGFFSTDDQGVCTEGGITGMSASIGSASGDGNPTNTYTCVGIQNNLAGQFIRTDRASISYFVPGATDQPPSTVVPIANVLGPSSTGPATTLPDGIKNESQVISGLLVLPSDIKTYISLNRADFPELPFTMIATVTVSGITSSGDRLDTNTADLAIEVVVDDPINPAGEVIE